MEFSLQGKEFIELNKLLKFLNIVESGGVANQVISNGQVLLNGTVDTRKRCKIRIGDTITIKEQSTIIKVIA
jgi:ribosome-associated protein